DARPTSPDGPQGTCFGFALHSAIPFRCLRGGAGRPLEVRDSPAVQVADPGTFISEWVDGTEPRAFARLYRDGSLYRLWTRGGGWSLIEPEIPRITLPPFNDPARSEENVWNIPIALCLLHRGDLALHAATVEINGQALMLVGAGRSGKTTLAAAFAQAGYRVLSEDVTCIALEGGPAIVPGPAMLRLRPDVLSSITLPRAEVLRRLPSRITMALGPENRGTSAPVPLQGIIMLETAATGFNLQDVTAVEAVPAIWQLTFMIPGDEWTAFCFTRLVDVVREVPVWRFERPLTFEALPETIRRLTALCRDGRR
ncbi:MAG: hypothetical protein ACRDF6_10155, partial [bacterium]